MRPARWWRVQLSVSAILTVSAAPALTQDASNGQSMSLSAAIEAAERGDFGDAERAQLADRGTLSVAYRFGRLHTEFELDDSHVAFRAETLQHERVVVVVEVGDVVVDVKYDPSSLTIDLDGHGHSFTVEQRIVLQALALRLELEKWSVASRSISTEKLLAYQLINLLSEAPVGLRLSTRTIQLQAPLGNVVDSTSSEKGRSSSKAVSDLVADVEPSFVCDEVNDEDGVHYYPCSAAIRTSSHDSCPQHGFLNFNILIGCSISKACPGRCGGGCGGSGSGKYTFDCADHDHCCRVHGGCFDPADAQCGDEYNHAVDDFFASANCSGCGGGGGGGGGGCGVFEDTRTWVIGPAREPRLASQQLQFGLERVETRPETTIYLEEWAVLSVDEGSPVVRRSSTPTFGMQVADSAHAFAAADGSSSTLLIVESAEHPHNARHIPTPTMAPLDVALDTEKLDEDQDFLFRAEVAATGVVDDVTLLDNAPLLPSDEVRKAIAANLRLQYADVRRHRSVVHAWGMFTSEGRMVVEHGLVTVVPCCCDDDCCFDPEYEIWLCPCGPSCDPT